MAKRSTNFNPRRPRITGGDMLNLATWLGMTDEEIRAMAQRHTETVERNKRIADEVIEQRRDRQPLAPVRGQLADCSDEDI